MTENKEDGGGHGTTSGDAAVRALTPEARRALEEAQTRRAAQKVAAKSAVQAKKEIGGRDGPDPIRYGDWDVNGRVSDF